MPSDSPTSSAVGWTGGRAAFEADGVQKLGPGGKDDGLVDMVGARINIDGSWKFGFSLLGLSRRRQHNWSRSSLVRGLKLDVSCGHNVVQPKL